MKTRISKFIVVVCCLTGVCGWSTTTAADVADDPSPNQDSNSRSSRSHKQRVLRTESVAMAPGSTNGPVVVENIDVNASDFPDENSAWLGLSTSEATEALTAQLGLEPGVGLVVDYVDAEGPAAKAGLEKNDLLIRFGDHWLSHPAQLRKLVQTRKQGDQADLTYYRKGQQHSVTVSLGKSPALKFTMPGTFHHDIESSVRDGMKALNHSLGNLKFDQEKLQREIKRSLERARQSMREGLKQMTNTDPASKALREALENIAGSGMLVDNDASVVVRSTAKNAKSIVKTDDNGTVVLMNVPKLRLTAHDASGNLVFDGPIESDDERAKVPSELWQRIEPLVKQMEKSAPKDRTE